MVTRASSGGGGAGAGAESEERPLETPSSEESGLGNSCDSSDRETGGPEATLVVPPDGGWGWVVVAASFLCNVLVDGVIFSASQVSAEVGNEQGLDKGPVAWMSSLLNGFYLLAGPFVSALANRYGFRIVTISGSILACAAFCVCYYVDRLEYLYVIYGVVGGIGFCLMYMPAVITVGFYFERYRALATGLALCGSGVGTMAIAPVTLMLLKNFGSKYTIVIHGVMMLGCGLLGLTFRPLKPVTVTLTDEDTEAEQAKRHEEAVEKLNTMFKMHQKLDSGLSLPAELRMHKGAPHTWMGVANNTKYPTAAEVFRGSNSTLNRRSSANAATIKNQIGRPSRYISVVPVVEKDEQEIDTNGSGENTAPLIERKSSIKIREPERREPSKRITEPVARPFYRDDIFFSGSLARLPQYQSHTSIGYHLAVTHVPTKQDVQEERTGCRLCPEAMLRILATMLDVSLFRSPTFNILALSGFFTMLGFFVPYSYVMQRAQVNGMPDNLWCWLVSIIGIANIVGRILCGLVSSFGNISSLWINNLAVTIGGIATMISGVSPDPVFQFSFCFIFGLSVACFASLRSILVVEYMGLEKLTNCFGLLMLFQGFGAILGSPIAGALCDFTGRFDEAFYLSGAFLLFSALICYPIDYVSRWEKNRDKLAKSNAV